MDLDLTRRKNGVHPCTCCHVDPVRDFIGIVEIPKYIWDLPEMQSMIQRDLEAISESTIKEDDILLRLASLAVHNRFGLKPLPKILHLVDLFETMDLDIWTRSPGLSWTERGYKTNNAIREDPKAIREVRRFWHEVKNGEITECPHYCVSSRTPMCVSDECKSHEVWDYPATVTFAEAMFVIPLIEGYRKQIPNPSGPIAYGHEIFGNGKMKKKRLCKAGYYIALDFKEFDETLPAWFIDKAFCIMMLNIDFVHWQESSDWPEGGITDAEKMYKLCRMLQHNFTTTKFRSGGMDGMNFETNKGISNGSYLAQLIRPICHAIVINYISLKYTSRTSAMAKLYLDDYVTSTKEAGISDLLMYRKKSQMVWPVPRPNSRKGSKHH